MEKNYFLPNANSSLQDNPKHLKTFVSEIVYQEQAGDVYEDYEAYHLIRDPILFLIEGKEVTLKEDPSFSNFDIEKFVSLAKKIPYFERERLIKESSTVFSNFLSKK